MQENCELFAGVRNICESSLENRFLKNWICFLFDEEIPMTAVPEKFRTGIFPLQILKNIGIRINTQNTFETVTNKQQCYANLRYFLDALVKLRLNVFDYKEKDLYDGKSKVVWGIIQLIFTDIFYPECLESSENLYSWLSQTINVSIFSENLLKVFSSSSIFLTLICSILKKSDLEDISNFSLKNILSQYKLPCFFEDSDFNNNTNFSFLYIQLWAIFLCFQENSLFCRSSTDSTSKDSILELNTSLDIFFNSHEDPSNNEKLSNIKKPIKSTTSRLSEADLILCYLMTPRIVQIVDSDKLIRVLLQFVKESQGSNKVSLNITELNHFKTSYHLSLDQIDHIESSDISMTFHIPNNNKLKIVFKNQSECSQYLNGIYSLY